MTIRINVRNGTLCVQVHGDLTEDMASELCDEIHKELAPRPRDVVLDLSDVETMDAWALSYVFRIQRETEANDNRMFVVGTRDPVLRLFAQTRVLDELELFESTEDALAAVV